MSCASPIQGVTWDTHGPSSSSSSCMFEWVWCCGPRPMRQHYVRYYLCSVLIDAGTQAKWTSSGSN
jgi:hypothetical protein